MPAVESPRSPAAAAAADEEAAAKALLSVGASTHFTPQHQKPATSAKRGLNLDAHQVGHLAPLFGPAALSNGDGVVAAGAAYCCDDGVALLFLWRSAASSNAHSPGRGCRIPRQGRLRLQWVPSTK